MTTYEIYQRMLDFLRLRKRSYQLTFPDPANNECLKDLAKFCRAGVSCFHDSQRRTDIALGRQEVWLRIQQHLKFEPDELYAIYNRPLAISNDKNLKQGAN